MHGSQPRLKSSLLQSPQYGKGDDQPDELLRGSVMRERLPPRWRKELGLPLMRTPVRRICSLQIWTPSKSAGGDRRQCGVPARQKSQAIRRPP
jgi:hypothetical protein